MLNSTPLSPFQCVSYSSYIFACVIMIGETPPVSNIAALCVRCSTSLFPFDALQSSPSWTLHIMFSSQLEPLIISLLYVASTTVIRVWSSCAQLDGSTEIVSSWSIPMGMKVHLPIVKFWSDICSTRRYLIT